MKGPFLEGTYLGLPGQVDIFNVNHLGSAHGVSVLYQLVWVLTLLGCDSFFFFSVLELESQSKDNTIGTRSLVVMDQAPGWCHCFECLECFDTVLG